jgi:hypothetical protein
MYRRRVESPQIKLKTSAAQYRTVAEPIQAVYFVGVRLHCNSPHSRLAARLMVASQLLAGLCALNINTILEYFPQKLLLISEAGPGRACMHKLFGDLCIHVFAGGKPNN